MSGSVDTKGRTRLLKDRYQLKKKLGSGGMGTVHLAWDGLLARNVAVKKLSDELSENSEALAIFLEEAQALARLSHPNLVEVYDVFSSNGAFMVQEYVRGMTVESILTKRGRLTERDTVKLGCQLVSVVDYLHSKDMLHRDIKPANIMLQSGGQLRLVDFGLARDLQKLMDRGTKIRGTPAYMSPEQILGEKLSSVSDVYQIGVTLFEMITNKLPFEDGDIGYAHVHKAPPRVSDLVSVSPEFDQFIDDCLTKNPAERSMNCRGLLARLEGIRDRLGTLSGPIPALDESGDSAWLVPQDTEQVVALKRPGFSLPIQSASGISAADRTSDAKISELELRLKMLESGHAIEGEKKRSPYPAMGAMMLLVAVLSGATVWWATRPDAPVVNTPPTAAVAAAIAAPSNPVETAVAPVAEPAEAPEVVDFVKDKEEVALAEVQHEADKREDPVAQDHAESQSAFQDRQRRQQQARLQQYRAAQAAEKKKAEAAVEKTPEPVVAEAPPKEDAPSQVAPLNEAPARTSATSDPFGVGLAPVKSSKGAKPLADINK